MAIFEQQLNCWWMDDWQRQLAIAKEWLQGTEFPDDILAPFAVRETIDDFDAFVERAQLLPGRWCFRGQTEADWTLQTSLDRLSRRELSDGYDHYPRQRSEADTLGKFKEVLQGSALPADDDLASWLSLMQHHGVPTRLLDWTFSPIVALFFALETAPTGARSALWAIDLDWLEATATELLGLQGLACFTPQEVNRQLTNRQDRPAILRVTPNAIPRRMAAQEGLLLCKLVDGAHFDKIVVTMLYHCSPPPPHPVVRKFEVTTERRQSMLERLGALPVTRDTLFPEAELDPFGAGVRNQLVAAIKKSIADGESFW